MTDRADAWRRLAGPSSTRPTTTPPAPPDPVRWSPHKAIAAACALLAEVAAAGVLHGNAELAATAVLAAAGAYGVWAVPNKPRE